MARKFSVPPHGDVEIVTDQSVVGRMVRAFRNEQALRIDDAASLCKVSVALLSALERSSSGRSVKLDKVIDVLDGMGLSLLITSKRKAREILSAHHDA